MERYKPNSHKSKERNPEAKTEELSIPPKKRFNPVVSGDTKLQKKSGLRKFADTFIAEDFNTVKDYIWSDIAVPKIKQLLLDMVISGASKTLGVQDRQNRDSGAVKTPYRRYYDERNGQQNLKPSRYGYQQNAANYDDIIFATRGDAELVLETMEEAVSVYGFVTILGMYDMSGRDCTMMPHTYDKYGWTDLKAAKVERTQGGWYIRLPRPIAI